MTEYVALVVTILGLMIYMLHLAFSLSDKYDPLKLFLITLSMVFGLVLIHLGKSISIDQGASTAIQNSLDIAYYVWIVAISLTLIYMVIYVIPDVWRAMKAPKKDMYEDDAQ